MEFGRIICDAGSRKFVASREGVERACAELARQINRQAGFERLAYIANGGKSPCEHVAVALGISETPSVVRIAEYKEGVEYQKAVRLEIPPELQDKDGSGLVFIDDIAGDGTTARLVKRAFPKARLGVCFSWPAALLERHNDVPLIDYVGVRMEKLWVVFPWEPEWEALSRM